MSFSSFSFPDSLSAHMQLWRSLKHHHLGTKLPVGASRPLQTWPVPASIVALSAIYNLSTFTPSISLNDHEPSGPESRTFPSSK